ncbi:endolytic transglycosylase MltG [Humidisolicoccus flavus]|uniref:endolytic transglycosylase MltG n=1 Tax=Humidisolicoccus flavus TaxID=3111414 RepID=UPI003254F339
MSRQRTAKKRRWILPVAIVAAVAVVGGIGAAVLGPRIVAELSGPEDYEGSGSGEVVVRIPQGATGSQVAGILFEADVVKSSGAFYELLLERNDVALQPGTFQLAEQMSASAALDALLDPANKVEARVVVPEGFTLNQVWARLAEGTGIPEGDFVKASIDPQSYGLPLEAVSLEGYLFPATYIFDPSASANEIIQIMVNRTFQALDQAGVAEQERYDVLTMASLIEREAGPVSNFGKVSRVFANRLDIGMLLQSDATVAYGTGSLHVITTTADERADETNPYNTYVHPGLPIGPIGAAGDAAIQAALNPEAGNWLYFVTVDANTGETVFSETYAEHLVAVKRFQEWLAQNPEYTE